MRKVHRHFGEVEVLETRVTVGGNDVLVCETAGKAERLLLADKRYWGAPTEPQTLEQKQAAMRKRNGAPEPTEIVDGE
jgi:hypothetical protein